MHYILTTDWTGNKLQKDNVKICMHGYDWECSVGTGITGPTPRFFIHKPDQHYQHNAVLLFSRKVKPKGIAACIPS